MSAAGLLTHNICPGILELRVGDLVQVIYNDALPASQCIASLFSKFGSDNSFQIQFRGELVLSPYPLMASNNVLSVTVNDFDLDRTLNPDSSSQWTSITDYSTIVNINSCLPSSPSLCLATGISRTIVLVETGGSTGQFTGRIQINRRAGNTSGIDGCSPGTVIQAFYTDETDGRVIGNRVKITEQASALISEQTVSAGGPVTITVVDPDLAYVSFNNLSSPQLTTPPASILFGGAFSESLSLSETGASTGYFTGVLMTTPFIDLSFIFSKWPICMNTYRPIRAVQRGDTLKALYSQGGPLPKNVTVSSKTSVQSGNILLSSKKAFFIPGDSVFVTVTDSDLNTDPFVSESATGMVTIFGEGMQCSPVTRGCVQVRVADGTSVLTGCTGFANSSVPCAQMRCFGGSCNYGDFETVMLKETSENSLNFTGIILTSTNTASLMPGDGQLFAADGTLLHAVYLDTLPKGDMHEDYLKAQSDITLNIAELDSNLAFAYNEALTIKLTDAAANKNWCTVENATIQITVYSALSPSSPKVVSVLLQETSTASGVFGATIFTQSTPGVTIFNNILSGNCYRLSICIEVRMLQTLTIRAGVTKGTTLLLSYYETVTEQSMSLTITAHERGQLSQTSTVLAEDGTLQITVQDLDLDINPSALYSISDRFILVSTSKDSEKERVPLTKSPSTGTAGVFVGLLPTFASNSRGKDFSGTLNAVAGDLLTVQYFDDAPLGITTVNVRVAMIGQLSKSPYLPAIGESIIITVYDLDAESVSIQIEKQPSYDGLNPTISLDAQEIGPGTGIFTASLVPVFGSPLPGQIGSCKASDVITATYYDM